MLHVWNIYQHLPKKSPSFVGKYTSTMEHLGNGRWFFISANSYQLVQDLETDKPIF